MKGTTRFRKLLATGDPFWAPMTYDALSARIAEAVGFEAVFVSGSSVSAAFAGVPDAGLTTMSEVLTVAQNVVNSVNVPVIVDIDTGWGNAINVRRTIQSFVRAGAAAVLLEDQQAPKRCGHIAGKQVIPIEEAVGKYRAAADAKNEIDPDFVVIARSDARTAAGGSLDEAIQRGWAYKNAGADMIFLEALLGVDEIVRVAREIPGPKMLNNGVGQTPALPLSQVKDLGYALVVSGPMYQAAGKAMWDFATALRQDGVAALQNLRESVKGHPLENMHAFAGFGEIRKMEDKYLPAEEVTRKYSDTIGQRF
ncbi:MAG: isocitrate lyase/PEP mutase family protein [Chloroflexi bacterium]|nr:isocitrate lyase/PEP mutase family protein [Chloroflexota bacterium]